MLQGCIINDFSHSLDDYTCHHKINEKIIFVVAISSMQNYYSYYMILVFVILSFHCHATRIFESVRFVSIWIRVGEAFHEFFQNVIFVPLKATIPVDWACLAAQEGCCCPSVSLF